jgi:hypothetical protein
MNNEESKERLDYSERMIQISDDVALNIIGGREEHKRNWLHNGRLELWLECETIAEFQRRARLSKKKAMELDKHFHSVYGGERLSRETPNKLPSDDAVMDYLKKLYGSEIL